MTRRLKLNATVALALFACSPSISLAQAPRWITVAYRNAPLSEVVGAFATLSGREIVLSPDVGNPEVTAMVQNVDWQAGLDRILETQALVARTDGAGVIRIERRRAITLSYQNAPLSEVLQAFATFSGRTIVLSPEAGDPRVTASIQNVDWQRALDSILESHALVARLDAAGVVRIETRNPARDATHPSR